MRISTKIVATLIVSGAVAGSAAAAPIDLNDRSQDVVLSAMIQRQLDAVPVLSAAGVRAEVVNHHIYIRGLVDTYLQKAEAEDVARSASSGERVLNLVEVSNSAA